MVKEFDIMLVDYGIYLTCGLLVTCKEILVICVCDSHLEGLLFFLFNVVF